MSVNRENVRKWVKALRSGKYEQTTEQLKRGVGYCCLGVACEISGVGDWDARSFTSTPYYRCDDTFDDDADYSDVGLPVGVQQWLGIMDTEPAVHFGKQIYPLTVLNDANIATGYGYPSTHPDRFNFDEIADLIEKEYLS